MESACQLGRRTFTQMSMASGAQSDKSPFRRSGNKVCVGYSHFSYVLRNHQGGQSVKFGDENFPVLANVVIYRRSSESWLLQQ
jgi:hypothetical protein